MYDEIIVSKGRTLSKISKEEFVKVPYRKLLLWCTLILSNQKCLCESDWILIYFFEKWLVLFYAWISFFHLPTVFELFLFQHLLQMFWVFFVHWQLLQTLEQQLQTKLLRFFLQLETIYVFIKGIAVLPRFCARACPQKIGKLAELWATISYEV